MLRTYKALLRGNRLEWGGEAPKPLNTKKAIPVHVTLLEEPAHEAPEDQRGIRMAEVLAQLADLDALSDITDPAAWERELREDRTLPERNP